jgi:hypothetical protein
VDRALNLDHLRVALGQSRGLPTPAELGSMLADSEAALLRGSQSVDDRVLATGWVLHSVGSSLASREIHGEARQRAALQVAGHIFDLALGNPDVEYLDRLRFTFASQTANLSASLDPNALAAYRWQLHADQLAVRVNDPTTSLRVGTALLAFDLSWLYPNLRGLLAELEIMRTTWDVHPFDDLFGSAARVVQGAWELLRFLVYGDRVGIDNARDQFRRAAHFDHPVIDLDSRWVAFHLWQLCDHLERASIWTMLPRDAPPTVPRAFTLSQPPILTLWPPQVDLMSPERRPYVFDVDARRLVLSIPTSAGKTLLAQLIAADHLTRTATGVCFVAPTRSLCREIESALRERLRMIRGVGEVRFDDELFVDDDDVATVEVMTPERLAYLLRSDPDAVLNRFGLFVIDEAHSVGDGLRGWTLEWVLSTLHLRTLETNHRILAMSAAIGNSGVFATWLDPAGEGFHFWSNWRGPRRVHALYTTVRDDATATHLPKPRRNSPDLTQYDLHGAIYLRPFATGAVRSMQTTGPIGTLVVRDATHQRVSNRSTAFYKTISPLAHILGRAGPVLIICPTKVEAANLASAIAESLEEPAAAWLIELATARLGADHPLVACLESGTAFHHASLPDEILIGIESELRSGSIKYVVATTTLTEGINLPVRTVIIAAQGSYGPNGYEEFIVGARLLNAIGRAGRAARESEGWIVLARHAAFSVADFARLQSGDEGISVRSALTTDLALAELANLEAAVVSGADVALAAAGTQAEAFLSFVWYVASVADGRGSDPQEAVETALPFTLAWSQLGAAHRRRYRRIARAAVESFQVRPEGTRQRWGRAGTAIRTAAALEAIALEIAAELERGESADVPLTMLGRICAAGRLDRLLNLPDANVRWPRNQRGGPGTGPIALDATELLIDWVSGDGVQAMAVRHFGAIADPSFRLEELADFTTAAFENFLPWTLGILVDWVNLRLREQHADPDRYLDPSISGLVRYGVSSTAALRLVRAGVHSRPVASAVARAYELRRVNEGQTLREWLWTTEPSEWRATFNTSPLDLRALLEYARIPGSRVAARLLAGEAAAIPVRPLGVGVWNIGSAHVTARASAGPGSQLEIWSGDVPIATLSPQYLAEIDLIVSSGMPVAFETDVVDDHPVITVRLADQT